MIPLLPSFQSVLFAAFLAALPGAHEDLELQIAKITRRIEASPSDGSLYYRRAELHRLHADGPSARADYARARERDPGLAEVDLGLGRLARAEGRSAEAVRHLGAYLVRRPGDPAGYVERARARAALGAWTAAREDYDAALARLPNAPPDLYVERARAIRSGGSPDQALDAIDAAIGRFGPLVTLLSEAVDAELAEGRLEAALRRIDAALEGPGRKERWRLRRGDVLRRLGRPDEAARAYAAALREIEALPPARRRTRETAALEIELNQRIRDVEATR